MSIIFHIATAKAWERARDEIDYVPEMFAKEGFIHCSKREQIIRVANLHFPGQHGMVLISINVDKVKPKIVYENLEGGEELFPHIYGKLNRDAIVAFAQFEPGADGSFSFPEEVER